MHRSGTSAVASVIESIGISLGNKTQNVDQDNPYGYFENKDFVEFNQKLLSYFSSRWDNPFFDCKASIESSSKPELNKWIKKATNLLKKNFTGISILAVKDPRNSILLPFWEMVLDTNKVPLNNVYYICMLRNPIEVASSQIRRYQNNPDVHFIGDTTEEVFVLWFYYYVYLLRNTRINKLLFINYKNLLVSPDSEIERICKFVGYKTNLITQHKINKDLYRNRSKESLIKISPVKKFYEFLNSFCSAPFAKSNDLKKFINFNFSFRDSLKINKNFSKYIFRQIDSTNQLIEKVHQLESENSTQNTQLEDLSRQISILCNELENERSKSNSLNSELALLKNKTGHLISSKDDLVQKLNKKHSNEISLLKAYHKILLKEWSEKFSHIAIYGAGNHTLWLLKIFEEIQVLPIAIYDDKPNLESINSIPVIPFSKINKLKVDAVITSSETYHEIMTKNLVKNYPNLAILNPYKELNIVPFAKILKDNDDNA